MKVALLTLGCKVNSYETEAVWEMLEKDGYQRVDFDDFSDVYIINTCSVTNQGEAKSRKMIRHASQSNPEAIVVVMGCFSQLRADEVLKIEGVKIVVGTNHRDMIPKLIREYLDNHQVTNIVDTLSINESYDNLSIEHFVKHQRAFLKIQDGCNNFCSYCIIPYARGRIRSKSPEVVIEEANKLVHSGFNEIILTGIHTGGYGLDFEDYRFVDLLKALESVNGLKRLRISSIEVTELTDDVIEQLKHSKIIVNHLHIPLQSGAERILHLMNRKYTKAEYLTTINELRSIKPNLSITTDVIVGFPSETEEDFCEMVDFIRQVNFSELHVFPFSKRDGTPAAKMSGQIDGLIKKERVNRLLELSKELSMKYAMDNLNREFKVIPESYQDGMAAGHSDNYLLIKFPGDKSMIGKIVKVRMTEPGYPENIGEIR
jgi:threonylcarbamoyladenosine tRNA methylthiotransferase MtaB